MSETPTIQIILDPAMNPARCLCLSDSHEIIIVVMIFTQGIRRMTSTIDGKTYRRGIRWDTLREKMILV